MGNSESPRFSENSRVVSEQSIRVFDLHTERSSDKSAYLRVPGAYPSSTQSNDRGTLPHGAEHRASSQVNNPDFHRWLDSVLLDRESIDERSEITLKLRQDDHERIARCHRSVEGVKQEIESVKLDWACAMRKHKKLINEHILLDQTGKGSDHEHVQSNKLVLSEHDPPVSISLSDLLDSIETMENSFKALTVLQLVVQKNYEWFIRLFRPEEDKPVITEASLDELKAQDQIGVYNQPDERNQMGELQRLNAAVVRTEKEIESAEKWIARRVSQNNQIPPHEKIQLQLLQAQLQHRQNRYNDAKRKQQTYETWSVSEANVEVESQMSDFPQPG